MDLLFLTIAIPLILVAIGAVLLFGGPNADKRVRGRLQKMRARVAPSGEDVLAAQMRRTIAARLPTKQGGLVSLLPNRDRIQLRLQQTGKDWSLSNYLMISVGIAVVVIGMLSLQGAPVMLTLLIGALLGGALPHMVVSKMIAKRQKAFTSRFPDAIDLLTRGLRAGLPIAETLSAVSAEIPGPVGVEFRQVIERVRIGKTLEQALQESADVIDTPEFQFFVITLAIQRETGGNLTETLVNLSEVLRKRAQMKLKIKAMSSEAKASAWIVGALPFCVFGLMYMMNPEYVSAFFPWAGELYDERVMVAGLGGLVWMGIGVFMMAKMVNFEI